MIATGLQEVICWHGRWRGSRWRGPFLHTSSREQTQGLHEVIDDTH